MGMTLFVWQLRLFIRPQSKLAYMIRQSDLFTLQMICVVITGLFIFHLSNAVLKFLSVFSQDSQNSSSVQEQTGRETPQQTL